MKKVHKTGGEEWAGVHYCFWCLFGIWCDALFIHCLQMHLHNTWCQSGPAGALYRASSSAWMEQANFLSGFVKIHLFFW